MKGCICLQRLELLWIWLRINNYRAELRRLAGLSVRAIKMCADLLFICYRLLVLNG